MARNPEIEAAIERGADRGKATLRRMQWKGAQAGNPTMLIWLGKQLLGQKDRSELTGAEDGPLRVCIELVGDPAPARVEPPQSRPRLSERTRDAVELIG